MARKQRNNVLESRTARLKLAVRRRPYPGAKLARGKQMQYRRNKGNGTWLLKVSDGHGKPWTKAFAQADDFDESDGKTILTFFEAQDTAKDLTRGADGSADSAPITVDGALAAYKTDLISRNANPYNADWPRAASHQRAAVKAGGIAGSHRVEAMARQSAGHDGPVDHQPAYRLRECRAGAGRAARQADSKPRRLGNRTGRSAECASKPATSSSPMTRCGSSSLPPTGSMISSGC